MALGLSVWKPDPGKTGPPIEPQGASGRIAGKVSGTSDTSMALNTYPPALSSAISRHDAAFLQVVGRNSSLAGLQGSGVRIEQACSSGCASPALLSP